MSLSGKTFSPLGRMHHGILVQTKTGIGFGTDFKGWFGAHLCWFGFLSV
jgi:hypothetical protein